MNIYKDWKAKLESAYSFMLKYSKITVWDWTLIGLLSETSAILEGHQIYLSGAFYYNKSTLDWEAIWNLLGINQESAMITLEYYSVAWIYQELFKNHLTISLHDNYFIFP